jgi:geranylgeranyl reductase family protein
MKETDIIIVGAGPAGSWLGFRLAKAGIESVILEKEKFPRYKACGGALSEKVMEFLPFSLEEVTDRHMAGAWISYGRKQVLVNGFGPAGVMVMRDVFDDFLVKRYLSAGGRFFDDHRVSSVEETSDGIQVATSDEIWKGKILIGADGASSFIRRVCGFGRHRTLFYALAAEMEVSEEVIGKLRDYACFDLKAIPLGYGWIFPKRNHLSIGVFTSGHSLDLRGYLKRFCLSHPLLRSGEIFHIRGSALPVGGYPRMVQRERVMLVGDAAGTVEPFLGEGIYNALFSADLAAVAIIGYINQNKPLSMYAERLAETIDKNIIRARLLAKVFYGHLSWTFPLLVQNRTIARAFARDIIGKSDFGGCLRSLVKRLPLIPFTYHRSVMRPEVFSDTSKKNAVDSARR